MTDRIISQANLDRIQSSLPRIENALPRIEESIQTVAHNLAVVSEQVEHVNQRVEAAESSLELLREAFNEFVQQDARAKQLQLAETRLVKVRQELEDKYGHYEEVRRRAVGILQAVDVQLVKKETIENASEEQLLAAPRYWLAPCLIALSAWINDNKELAERAVMEALRRDDEKTSLFFALVSRRAARYKASREWLERYLGYQDPQQLQREIVILIDGFTNGIFGPDARTKCGKMIENWIAELSQQVGFVEEQREQWKKALQSKLKPLDGENYHYLRQYSPTWTQLKKSLEGAKLHTIIYDYFTEIFAREITPSKNIAFAVDELLDNLVSNYDDEEMPLRRDERLYNLIVNEDGDKAAAEAKFNNEKLFEDRVSFTQLLTNFSMYPEVSNASVATQKLSLALSKEWISHAHGDLTLKNRNQVPQLIEIEVDTWSGMTRNGSNELELIEDLSTHMNERKAKALRENKLRFRNWLTLAAGAFFTFFGIQVPFLFAFAIIFYLIFLVKYLKIKANKSKIAEDYDKLLASCKDIVRAVIADIVDYRREYEEEDACADKIDAFLETITPEQYTFTSFDTARAVIHST
ncbi:hypothetical protein [Paenibacillus sp. GCM10027626]|uniref:hypothetical protein n=1 Tax=Paenibacillus sp. GCM10027626 TaxID=3273411 RepID=UPI00363E56C3